MKTPLALIALVTASFFSCGASAATVLVTGSNRGLGFEFARQYAEQGWTVIATARNPESAKELQALAAKHKSITIEKLDLFDHAGIKALAAKYKGRPIDVIVNNAGVLGDLPGQTLGSFDYANFQQVMGVNVYGPLAVSEAFRENVSKSEHKKIVAITSGSGIISRGGGGGKTHFYRASKVALNMVMRGLANDLKGQGVIVGIIAPGSADTDMRRELVGADRAAKDQRPEQSVASMMKVIAGLTQANSDKPLNYDGSVLPW
ncbi:MAG: SDR family oxidoreductase [Opitutus sp.]|nr:SDR family oxidoreductase [Opitutus sp.]